MTKPDNPVPFSQGNSAERTEAAVTERARGPETTVKPNEQPPEPEPEEKVARVLPQEDSGIKRAPETSRPAPGALGDALRNLERYVQNETFHNPQGGATDPGATIQFDTKGVEFGPWLRRFVAQVRRNWFVPYAAMTFRGRVVVQFNIHKDGTITELVVAGPSDIDAFNRAAHNAILGSNPTEPLPPEYPEPVAFFTVTFYYNEQPPLWADAVLPGIRMFFTILRTFIRFSRGRVGNKRMLEVSGGIASSGYTSGYTNHHRPRDDLARADGRTPILFNARCKKQNV